MRVALVQLPFPLLPEEPRHLSPPLGLAYIAATVEMAGHEAMILDSLLEGYRNAWPINAGLGAYGLDPTTIAERVADLQPDLIGLSCLFSTQDDILRAVARAIRLRLPDVPIVLGGTHPTVFARNFVADGTADFVVRGEGERALVQLVDALDHKHGLGEVAGLTWHGLSEVCETPVQRIDDLDALPLPARCFLDMDAYAAVGVMHGENQRNVPTTTIYTSRGCPASCTFCSIHPVWGHRFRAVSSSRVLAEIGELYNEFNIRHLLVEDDNFTFDQNRAKEILQGIVRSWPDLTWSAPNGVAVWWLDDELIELIAASGCQRLSLAIESGCNRTLEQVINKPLNLDKVNWAVAACRRFGIRTTAFFVLGIPGETRADMLESMRFACRLEVDTLSVMTAVPLPGSPLYQQALSKGWVDSDVPFTAYTTRNPILRTTEFDPIWVDRLARRAMMHHALKHPRGYLVRIMEKMTTSPVITARTMARSIAASLRI